MDDLLLAQIILTLLLKDTLPVALVVGRFRRLAAIVVGCPLEGVESLSLRFSVFAAVLPEMLPVRGTPTPVVLTLPLG